MTTQTIAQELVKGCRTYEIQHGHRIDDKKPFTHVCGDTCYKYKPLTIFYCHYCRNQASIYARALNEELEWLREYSDGFGFMIVRFSFIESELKILKDGGLI